MPEASTNCRPLERMFRMNREPDDARLVALLRAFEQRPAAAVPRRAQDREAAVALVLRPREELEVLLIKRAERADDPWSGHMALPGGRRAPDDPDLLATAKRETEEETHLPLERVGTFIGRLDDVAPGNRRLPPIVIAPFVLGVPPSTTARPDGREVDATLWVPLSALREPGAVSELLIELGNGESRRFPSLLYQDHVIWGLTHGILTTFLRVAEQAGV